MNVHFETDRLIIRDLEEGDALDIFELDSDPEVHRYLGNHPITTMAQAEAIIQSVRNQYVENGIGRWAMIDRITKDFVGWTGLKYEEQVRKEFSYYDLGYRLKRKHWGKGFATESAKGSLEYGFCTYKLQEIFAAADILNQASNKILQNLGFQYVEQFDFDGQIHNWYKITKDSELGS